MARPLICLSLLVALLASGTGNAQQQPALLVKAHFDLTPAADGFTGRLELLEDARITPELDKSMWQSGGPDMALDPNDPLLKELDKSPLQPAVLRLRDGKRSVIAEKKLEREQARLEAHQLHPGHRSIFVTTDLSAGFGSYSGPLTQILDLSAGALAFVQARDPSAGKPEIIFLPATLKTAWRLVVAPASSGPAHDILKVACRPDAMAKSSRFTTTYTRYHWNGSEWVVASLERAGICESDESFPSLVHFPSIPMKAY
jgi:hypothetical protein